jgi:hypothetical protein
VWELPAAARALALAVLAAVVALLALRFVLHAGRHLASDDAAGEVEAGFPALGQRVRTTLEYAEPTPRTAPAAPALNDALTADTERRTRALDLPAVVSWRSVRAPAGALALLVALGTFLGAREPELRVALARVFLLPLAYTELTVKPGNDAVNAGAEFTIEAGISGRAVRRAEWRRRAASQGPWTAVALGSNPVDPEAAPKRLRGTLSATLKDCRESFEYQVVAGSVSSPIYHVKVIQPLVLEGVKAEIVPPAYTRKPPTTVQTGDFSVIETSDVRLRLALNRAPKSAELVIKTAASGKKEQQHSVPIVTQGNVVEAALPALDHSVTYTLAAQAADGVRLDPRSFKIRVEPDGKPALRFIQPHEELVVIATAEVPIEVEADDDFGLAKVGIRVRIDGGDEETLLLDEPKGQPVKANEMVTLFLEKYKLDLTSSVSYSAFAEDNHPGTPHRTTSELRFIDIRPFKLTFGIGESDDQQAEGESRTLEELIYRQRANLNATFSRLESPNAAAARRIANAEEELADLTAEFAQGLAAMAGPVQALELAAGSMRAAVGDLDRSQWKTAVEDQEAALNALIKARQNLKKLLSDSASARAARQFDRQQQQKLRKPPKKKDPQLAEQIQELAEEERAVSKELASSEGQNAPAKKAEALAKRQEAAAQKAAALKEAVQASDKLTESAVQRMDQAAGSVNEGRDALNAGKREQAAERAETAAGQLERLAEQVAGLETAELASRLAQASNLARSLATEQADPKGATAPMQSARAERAATLGDWLDRLAEDAAEESRAVADAVKQAMEANRPAAIVDAMQSMAQALKAGPPNGVERQSRETADRLTALAQDLDDARRAYMQPRLDDLLAAEALAEKTESLLNSVHNNAEKAEAEKAMGDLAEALEKLGARGGDESGALAKTASALEEARAHGGGWGDFQKPPNPGPNENRPVLVPPGAYTDGVSHAITALQAEIQQVVLRQVLLEKDEAVPPQYKALVEDYYKALSEDLR